MKLYYEGENFKLYNGNMLDVLEVVEPASIGAVITDPPYELNFMNKGWDNSGIAFQADTWRKCFDVLKPGGYLLAFGGSRTFHRIAVAIEDAGFEIRDVIMWLYGTGFPKPMNLGKGIEAKLTTGSANTQEFKNLNGLKAASGDWGISKNSHEYGARPSDYSADKHLYTVNVDYTTEEGRRWDGWGTALKPSYEPIIVARKPCEGSCTDNVLKYGVGGLNIDDCRIGDEVVKTRAKDGTASFGMNIGGSGFSGCEETSHEGRFPANTIFSYKSDNDEIRRYFYCAKATTEDRNEGLDTFCNHPTVKPTELMRYLIRLVTPEGETILDTFNGSGSTGKAAMLENVKNNKNYKYIGIELTEEYLPLAKARIEYVLNRPEIEEIEYDDGSRQMNIFDFISKEE